MSFLCQKDWISPYKVAPGVWWRRPGGYDCMANNESASKCSRDTYLPILLDAHVRGNKALVQEIYDVGKDKDWIMCEGDKGRTSILPLVSLMKVELGIEPPVIDVGTFPIPEEFAPTEEAVTGFRAHLIDGYLWYRADVLGGLKTAITLKTIHDKTPGSPWFSSLFHRFDKEDNDQAETIDLLKAVPDTDDAFGWGGSPPQFHKAAPYVVLMGK
jgi:hypothetical protein